jgi:excisionase family DNA binding protein
MSLEDIIGSRKTALTVAEVAALLNVSGRLVYQLVAIGDIPHFRVGSAVRFEPKALSEWLHGKLKASGREAEYAALSVGHEHIFEPFGDMTEWWTKWWSEVLLATGQS